MIEQYNDERVIVYGGDCREVLAELSDGEGWADAIVCDPPYELGFMGKSWDGTGVAYDVETWKRCYDVLKPGGHLLAFGGSRTWHRMAVAIEDAGFEMRDSIAWLYGSGFPKSMDVSKAIDKAAGAQREVVGSKLDQPGYHLSEPGKDNGVLGGGHGLHVDPEARLKASQITAPATDAAKQWEGWGTALKPAFEPIVVARKPFKGTVAANVLSHNTGALNIDACRIHTPGSEAKAYSVKRLKPGAELNRTGGNWRPEDGPRYEGMTTAGRWPTNVVLDGDQADELDQQSGSSVSRVGKPRSAAAGDGWGMTATGAEYDDQGGASRFFPVFRYQAKAPTKERPKVDGVAHPTVKPLELMRWLVRLVTPPDGIVVDPFAGSGTTLEAAMIEGMHVVGIENDPAHIPLIMHRIERAKV